MLKKLRKSMLKKRLIAALVLGLALTATPAPANADIGAQLFYDGQPHTVTDNIVASGARGLDVRGVGTSAVMNGYSITAAGAHGAYAENGGAINMTGGTITTSGFAHYGAFAYIGGSIALTNVSIVTSGDSSWGTFAWDSAPSFTLTNVNVTTTGSSSSGVVFSSGNRTLTNVAITTAGVYSHGVLGDGGAIISMAGGSINTSGNNSYGIVVQVGSAINMTNVAVATTGYALYANFGGATINATVSGQDMSGVSGLLRASNGTVNITADGSSRLYGTTTLDVGGMANLTLNGAAAWTMPGASSLTTLTLSGGTVNFTAPSGGYKTLVVAGNLAGSGGAFNLNTNLTAGLSDLVSIGGAASGSHQIFFTNRGGSSNLRQAVKVVDLNESAINTATFSGGSDIGAYRYCIARGSAVPAGYNGVSSPVDIYLYNTLIASPPAAAAVSTTTAPSVMWYGEMNDIKKRLGELRLGAPTDDFWARSYAGKYTVKPSGDQSFNQIMRGLEIGKDSPESIKGGKRYTGWVAGVGRANNTFNLGGSGSTDSFYLGAYRSWFKDDGSYLDIVGKYNWFRHSFSAPLLGGGTDSAAYKNTGFGISVETGKRIENGNGFFVEPQAEIAALWSQSNNYITANGLAVIAPTTTSLQLRLGAAIGKKTTLTGGGSNQVYGKLSWVEELAGQNRTTVDAASFKSSLKGGRLVAGLGFVEDTAKRQLYLDLETAWGKTTSKPWGVNLGCRWKL